MGAFGMIQEAKRKFQNYKADKNAQADMYRAKELKRLKEDRIRLEGKAQLEGARQKEEARITTAKAEIRKGSKTYKFAQGVKRAMKTAQASSDRLSGSNFGGSGNTFGGSKAGTFGGSKAGTFGGSGGAFGGKKVAKPKNKRITINIQE